MLKEKKVKMKETQHWTRDIANNVDDEVGFSFS